MTDILVVEDDEAIANLICVSLSAEGYRCTCARDGMEGADYIERQSFDLVLLDIMLPEVDGYELLEYIKPTGTPVIFLTARGSIEDKVRGLRAGADDYLSKPFQIGELLARVEAVLRGGRERPAGFQAGAQERRCPYADGEGVRPASGVDAEPEHRPVPGAIVRKGLEGAL